MTIRFVYSGSLKIPQWMRDEGQEVKHFEPSIQPKTGVLETLKSMSLRLNTYY
jgi:hypothetical protein